MSKLPKIIKARAGLIIDHPFFASILLPMEMRENSDITTMATDGESISYNPDWCETLSISEMTFVLAHEALHCMFDHMGRRGNRGPNRWNQAADYVINQLLVNERIGSMPSGGLLNQSLVQAGGGTAEGIYKLLPEENEGKESGSVGGALDHVHDAGSNQGESTPDSATMSEKSAEIRIRVVQAKNVAKMQGRLSAGLERLVDSLLKPEVDWRDVLRRFISERAKVDHTFARPKRRFLGEDLYLPSMTGEKMGKISVGVDCSGSIDQEILSKFGAEINAIREDVHPGMIEIIYFDSRVCHVDVFGPNDEIKLKPKGGGGTAFSPVFKYINDQFDDPACAVILTDLCCDDFGPNPSYPVLWCCVGSRISKDEKVPFGEIVPIGKGD